MAASAPSMTAPTATISPSRLAMPRCANRDIDPPWTPVLTACAVMNSFQFFRRSGSAFGQIRGKTNAPSTGDGAFGTASVRCGRWLQHLTDRPHLVLCGRSGLSVGCLQLPVHLFAMHLNVTRSLDAQPDHVATRL